MYVVVVVVVVTVIIVVVVVDVVVLVEIDLGVMQVTVVELFAFLWHIVSQWVTGSDARTCFL